MTLATLPEQHRTSPSPSSLTPPAPPKRPRRRKGFYLVAFIIVVGAAALLWRDRIQEWFGSISQQRSADTDLATRRTFPIVIKEKGELQAKESVDVKCEVEGRSTIIWLIPEGTEVKKGDLLVNLASNEIDERIQAEEIKLSNAAAAAEAADKELEILLDQNASDIRQAQLNVRNAEIELEKYTKGDYELQMTEKKLALERAKKLLEQAQSIEEDSRQLRAEGHITLREYDDDALKLYEAEVNVHKAQLDLEIFEEYTHPKDLEQKQSDLSEAGKDLERTRKRAAANEDKQKANTEAKHAELKLVRERLDRYLTQKENTAIHAPAAGLVVYFTGRHRWDRKEIAEGAEVYERQTIISLPDTSVMEVKLRIHESKTNWIALGQRATVEVEGIPDAILTGTVTRIAPLADSQGGWMNPDLKEYDAEITLDESETHLKPGVTARARITVDTVQNAISVPAQAIYSTGPVNYVFVGTSQESCQPVPVKIGQSSDTYVEILDGLDQGDPVLLAITEEMTLRIPTEPHDPPAEDVNLATESDRDEPAAKTATNTAQRSQGAGRDGSSNRRRGKGRG